MKDTKVVAIILVTIILAAGVLFIIQRNTVPAVNAPLNQNQEKKPVNENQPVFNNEPATQAPTNTGETEVNSDNETTPEVHSIEMSETSFTPSDLTIRQGETVRFINKGSTDMWPASAFHPTHEVCPGFDALRAIKQGETYSYTFNEVKDCPFHDHLNLSLRGKISVIE